ncbi:hypothetical protein MtrunA17_Chr6g0483041 [Medicago truncatula]|uniref:Uncharacterized protein n=1 Tax=Medicago truncatula TaxID=3880 RepID=A0A396HJI0_MEDTR|nr:hypothetical protein MtrunA17_Chr6g0483041 [Medicago truncatula]
MDAQFFVLEHAKHCYRIGEQLSHIFNHHTLTWKKPSQGRFKCNMMLLSSYI